MYIFDCRLWSAFFYFNLMFASIVYILNIRNVNVLCKVSTGLDTVSPQKGGGNPGFIVLFNLINGWCIV